MTARGQSGDRIPRDERCDVLLVVPPFASANWPALGVSILAQAVRDAGISCDVQYPNLDLWRELGHDLYNRISLTTTRELAGELLFASFAFDENPGAATARHRIRHALDGRAPLAVYTGEDVAAEELVAAVDGIEAFVDRAVNRILRSRARIVGFSAVFQQTAASIALARRLKATAPHIVTVLGGAMAEWPMGAALAETTSAFDFVFSGEADAAFPAFCRRLVRDEVLPTETVIRCTPVNDLESTARPRYDDWFDDARRFVGGGHAVEPDLLHFESSRGCWWGQKSHCTFCGLNAHGMAYRRKSDGRVLEELRAARARWSVNTFHAVDNIMPFELPKGLLRTLADEDPPFDLFYEVKANLSDHELDRFVDAGVRRIQPGIESISTPALKRMKKGVTGPQNIRLLRECRAREIDVAWLWLVGLPGEETTWVEDTISNLPLLEHLVPPGISHLRIDRFSPYFDTPERFSIRDLKPLPVYESIYPPGAPLGRIAYHFHGRWPSALNADPDLASRLMGRLRAWRQAWSPGSPPPELRWLDDGGHGAILDSRRCAPDRLTELSAAEGELLHELDRPRRRSRLQCDEAVLERLMRRRWVISHDGYLLSLVVHPEVATSKSPSVAAPAATGVVSGLDADSGL